MIIVLSEMKMLMVTYKSNI